LSLFSHRLKGTLAAASVAMMFRYAPGVGTVVDLLYP
jgi:hypothetical protein